MKLLSPKRLAEFSSEEFHNYIKSLYHVRTAASTVKSQKERAVRVKRKKKGGLSIVTSRSPKYITTDEVAAAVVALSVTTEEILSALSDLDFRVYADHKAAEAAK